MEEMDPELLDFIKTKVNSFIKWDLIRFFYENPHTADTVESIARYAGRSPEAVKPELEEMVQSNLLEVRLVAGVPVYSFTTDLEMRRLTEKFIRACQDRQFRVKAVYHIIRGMR